MNETIQKYAEQLETQDILDRGISVAKILSSNFDLGPEAENAAILNEILPVSANYEQIEKDFGRETVKILQGIRKIETLPKKNIANHKENFIKLILTIAEDIRSVLVLLAKYLYLLRNLELLEVQQKKNVLDLSENIFSVIAHRLGLYKLKGEFDDKVLFFKQPEVYNAISGKLKQTREKLDLYIKNFIEEIDSLIKPLGYKYRIKGRVKSVPSIWHKMRRKGVEFEEVLDIFAIRIILDVEQEREIGACWDIFSVIQKKYVLHPQRIKDWLSNPKSNGYMSLHTTVLAKDGRWVELQIRSERMDEIAEKGFAAHWKYKEYSKKTTNKENLYAQLRDAIQKPVERGRMPVLVSGEIFVYTPNGDLKSIPKGATVLDFAFYIHTDLGEHCVGALVNDKFVSYKHVLNNGDVVKIIVSANQKPKPEWLDIAITNRARRKIKQLLAYRQYKWIHIGRESLQRKLKRLDIEYSNENLEKIRKFYGFDTITQLFEQVGAEKIDLKNLKSVFEVAEQDTNLRKDFENNLLSDKQKRINYNRYFLLGEDNLKDVEYKIAKCCNPSPGDNVFILKTLGGLVVHKVSCRNAADFVAKNSPDRYIAGKWSPKTVLRHFTKVRMKFRKNKFDENNLKKIFEDKNLPVYRLKISKIGRKMNLFRAYVLTKPLEMKAKDELKQYLNEKGFFKIGFVKISAKI